MYCQSVFVRKADLSEQVKKGLQSSFEIVISKLLEQYRSVVLFQQIDRRQGHSVEGVVFDHRIHCHIGKDEFVTTAQRSVKGIVTDHITC